MWPKKWEANLIITRQIGVQMQILWVAHLLTSFKSNKKYRPLVSYLGWETCVQLKKKSLEEIPLQNKIMKKTFDFSYVKWKLFLPDMIQEQSYTCKLLAWKSHLKFYSHHSYCDNKIGLEFSPLRFRFQLCRRTIYMKKYLKYLPHLREQNMIIINA